MQTPRERDMYLRVFPDPLPDHMEYVIHWKDNMHLSIKVRHKNPPTTPAEIQAAPEPLPDGHPPIAPDSPAAMVAVRRKEANSRFTELVKLARTDLIILAAKQGLRLASSLSVATMAARIVDHEEAAKAAELGPPKEIPAEPWKPAGPTPKAHKEETSTEKKAA